MRTTKLGAASFVGVAEKEVGGRGVDVQELAARFQSSVGPRSMVKAILMLETHSDPRLRELGVVLHARHAGPGWKVDTVAVAKSERPPVDTSRERFQALALKVGSTGAALALLAEVREGGGPRDAEALRELGGFSRLALEGLAARAADGRWLDAAGVSSSASGGAELARELGLDRGIPVSAERVKALNAKYPLSGRLADEFPEGAVFGGIGMALYHASMTGIGVDAGTHQPIGREGFVRYLTTLAAEKPDLAAAVLSDAEVRAELARSLTTPLDPSARAAIPYLARLPTTLT